MSPWERALQYGANVSVVGSGIVYAGMRYLLPPVDEWAVINHPWQPHVQHFHVLTAPLLVFACGLIWRHHVSGRLANGERRKSVSGPGLAVAFAPMIASGYLLQTSSGEGWRRTWLIVHLVASGLWILLALLHFLRWRPARVRAWLPSSPRSSSAAEPAARAVNTDRGPTGC